MKTPMALSVTSSQREQTSLRSQAPRLPRSNVCSTRDLENPSASVHLKRFSTPSLTLKFLCAGKLNPRLFFFTMPPHLGELRKLHKTSTNDRATPGDLWSIFGFGLRRVERPRISLLF